MTSSELGTHAAGRVPLRLDTHEGGAAVFIPRWTTAARVGRLVLAIIVLAAVVGGLVAVLAAEWGVVLLLLVISTIVAALLVRETRTMPFDGGVWLTPTGLVHTWGGRTWSVGWDEVDDARLEPGSGDVVVTTGGGVERVSTHLLVVSHRTLTMLLGTLAAEPHRRATLGTDAGLRWVSEVRATLDASGFEPTVHHAPRVTSGTVFTLSLVLAAVLLVLAALGRASG